jgi:hypothetical protein
MIAAGTPIRWNDPATWPWMFYVWAAFVLAGWAKPAWSWLRSKRAAGWPLAEGRIDSVEITKPIFSFTTRRGYYVVELGYTYSVAGTRHSGRYRRELPTEQEANEFVRDLQGKPVAVHCSPTIPSSSALLDPDINALQQNRAAADSAFGSLAVDSVPDWIRPFLWVFVSLSVIGLVVSLWVHLGAATGRHLAPGAFFWVLHVGIFVVWFPAVFVAQRLVGNLNRGDFWKVVLKDSPDWMRYMVYGFLAYALVNFMFFLTQAPTRSSGANPPAEVWRGFSGHWMAFYSAALAILYSAARNVDKSPRCANGHIVSPRANYCTRCGQSVVSLH